MIVHLVPHLSLRKNPYLLQGAKSEQTEDETYRQQGQAISNSEGETASAVERPNLHVKCDRHCLFAKTRCDYTLVLYGQTLF